MVFRRAVLGAVLIAALSGCAAPAASPAAAPPTTATTTTTTSTTTTAVATTTSEAAASTLTAGGGALGYFPNEEIFVRVLATCSVGADAKACADGLQIFRGGATLAEVNLAADPAHAPALEKVKELGGVLDTFTAQCAAVSTGSKECLDLAVKAGVSLRVAIAAIQAVGADQ